MEGENENTGRFAITALALVAAMSLAGATKNESLCDAAPDWPPVEARALAEARGILTPEARTGGETHRAYEVYAHGLRKSWGYAAGADRRDFLVVVPPVAGHRPGAPLVVMLHSAGCMIADKCVRGTGPNHLPSMFRKGNVNVYSVPDHFYAIFPDCGIAGGDDWWWGNRESSAVRPEPTPCERRILDEIEWAVAKYGIDRNRIYLTGNSMGGSGTLGFGLRHGEIFAAIKANVPAGVGHALGGIARWKGTPLAERADPPVVIDYSATDDGWSRGHEKLVDAMHQAKLSFHFYWGAFGHNGAHAKVRPHNDIYDCLDWRNIRLDEAYPVFTDASTDEKSPWPETGKLPPGEINGYFKWKNVTDANDSFAMDVGLVSAEEAKSKIFKIPTESIADVTLRRIQRFGIRPGDKITWAFGSAHGVATADETGHVTLPRLRITTNQQRLRLTR